MIGSRLSRFSCRTLAPEYHISMSIFDKLLFFVSVFSLLVVQAKEGRYAKTKKTLKPPTEKELYKGLVEGLDIISQAADHFKFFRECFMDYEDPADIALFSRQLDEARKYFPRSLDKLQVKIKKFNKSVTKIKLADKLVVMAIKLHHKINSVLALTAEDIKRIELGMKKYMQETLLTKGGASADQFSQEAMEISETLKKLRPKDCVSMSCDMADN